MFVNLKTVDAKNMPRLCVIFTLIVVLTNCGGGSGGGSGGGGSVSSASSSTSSSSSSSSSASAIPKPTGFYALSGQGLTDTTKTQLLNLPYVDGMASYVRWSDIEAVQGVYDYSLIDHDIALARAAGKKITIGVFTGKNAIPTWVSGAGVNLWTTSLGDSLIFPTDTTFITLWRERVRLLGLRYDQDDTVIQITMCGAAGTLCGPRYPELPSGVTYAQLVTAWTPIVTAYNDAFPNTYKNLEVQQTTNGFGANLPVDLFSTLPQTVKIGPFAEFLSDTAPLSTSGVGIAFAQIASTRDYCGFQMVSPLATNIGLAILHGRSYGCGYFEIYSSDLLQQATIIAPLH